MRAAADFFQKQSGCEAVGIRLKEGDDYPYYVTRGFPPEHVRNQKNEICAKDDTGCVVRDSNGNPVIECMCGNVVSGRFDPSKEFFTVKGSFWTNNTTQLLATQQPQPAKAIPATAATVRGMSQSPYSVGCWRYSNWSASAK